MPRLQRQSIAATNYQTLAVIALGVPPIMWLCSSAIVLLHTSPPSQVARIHAMDYVTQITPSGVGRDLTCVEVFSGKQTLVSAFRSLA